MGRVGKQIVRFCNDIVSALRKPWESSDDRHRKEESEALRRAEEERLRKEDDEPRMLMVRAVDYCEKGDFDHAIADVTEALRLEPSARGYCFRGDVYAYKQLRGMLLRRDLYTHDSDHAIADYDA
jgi:hypothetical protein